MSPCNLFPVPSTMSASTLIAAAAFTGARRGELRGMYWGNCKDGELLIVRSIWNGITTDPKVFQSSASWPRSWQNIASDKAIRQLARFSRMARLARIPARAGYESKPPRSR
jgi:hypothetical protein